MNKAHNSFLVGDYDSQPDQLSPKDQMDLALPCPVCGMSPKVNWFTMNTIRYVELSCDCEDMFGEPALSLKKAIVSWNFINEYWSGNPW